MSTDLNLTLIQTDDGTDTVYWSEYGESFHSGCGALTETQRLYMQASGFAARLAEQGARPVHVLDVGLGLGYNALETISTWANTAAPAPLQITSLEMSAELVQKFASVSGEWMTRWPKQWLAWSASLQSLGPKLMRAEIQHPTDAVTCVWHVVIDDASRVDVLPAGEVDFVWQDAFSPKRNPEMWTPSWFARVYSWCGADAVIASYSCARVVKDALTSSGWDYRRIKASIGKRHWLLATKPKQPDLLS